MYGTNLSQATTALQRLKEDEIGLNCFEGMWHSEETVTVSF